MEAKVTTKIKLHQKAISARN